MNKNEYNHISNSSWDNEIFRHLDEFNRDPKTEHENSDLEIYQTSEYEREEQRISPDQDEPDDGLLSKKIMRRIRYGLAISASTVVVLHTAAFSQNEGTLTPLQETVAEAVAQPVEETEAPALPETETEVEPDIETENESDENTLLLSDEEINFMEELWGVMEREDRAQAETMMLNPMFDQLCEKMFYHLVYKDGACISAEIATGSVLAINSNAGYESQYVNRNVFWGNILEDGQIYGTYLELSDYEQTEHVYYKGYFVNGQANGQGELLFHRDDAPAGGTVSSASYIGEFRDSGLYNGQAMDESDSGETRVEVVDGVVAELAFSEGISQDAIDTFIGVSWRDGMGWQQAYPMVFQFIDYEEEEEE